jgi:hypothetical protein
MCACCCLCIGSVILKLDAATADAAVELPAQTSEKKTNADMSTTSCNSTAHALPYMLSPRQVCGCTTHNNFKCSCVPYSPSACGSCYMPLTLTAADVLLPCLYCKLPLDARRSCAFLCTENTMQTDCQTVRPQ